LAVLDHDKLDPHPRLGPYLQLSPFYYPSTLSGTGRSKTSSLAVLVCQVRECNLHRSASHSGKPVSASSTDCLHHQNRIHQKL